jgi:hypothetical protein
MQRKKTKTKQKQKQKRTKKKKRRPPNSKTYLRRGAVLGLTCQILMLHQNFRRRERSAK